MNKYLWAECPQDYWPTIKTTMAKSYNDAVEKLIIQYGTELEDDSIINSVDNWEELREALNDIHSIALSDLEIYEEL